MMRKSQESRMLELAKTIEWSGSPIELADFVAKGIAAMPEKVGAAMKSYYIDSEDAPRRGDGGYNVYFYQTLTTGRAALYAILHLSQDLYNQVQNVRQKEGGGV
jgi:hypothetical protein